MNDYGKNPEPVTIEQALENAVLWATKAGTLAAEQKRDAMERSLAYAGVLLGRALAKARREKPPEDPGDMALRYAGQAVIPDRKGSRA